MSNRLAELQMELDTAVNNRVKAENDWNHIKNTASEQTLLVGKTRMYFFIFIVFLKFSTLQYMLVNCVIIRLLETENV